MGVKAQDILSECKMHQIYFRHYYLKHLSNKFQFGMRMNEQVWWVVFDIRLAIIKICFANGEIQLVYCSVILQAGWTNLNSSLRGNLRKLSKSLRFVSARRPGSKLTFDNVMSEAKNATIGVLVFTVCNSVWKLLCQSRIHLPS